MVIVTNKHLGNNVNKSLWTGKICEDIMCPMKMLTRGICHWRMFSFEWIEWPILWLPSHLSLVTTNTHKNSDWMPQSKVDNWFGNTYIPTHQGFVVICVVHQWMCTLNKTEIDNVHSIWHYYDGWSENFLVTVCVHWGLFPSGKMQNCVPRKNVWGMNWPFLHIIFYQNYHQWT